MGAMERAQAAEFLGVSVSTLDRFASQGRLTRGRARRKTRPVTTFDEGELTRLKAELEQAGKAVKTVVPEAGKPQDAVGFRLDPSYVERLKSEGAKRGMSVGEYARSLVVRGLEDTGAQELAEELKALRKGLSNMFYIILVQQFEATPEEAQKLIARIGG